jgi:hypothetical protein
VPTIVSKIIALVVVMCLAGCQQPEVPDGPVAQLAHVPGRNYFSLSVHPNGQELLFLEYREDWPGFFRLQRYHMGTQKMQYYQLPADHVYRDAAFSASGNYILLRRAPNQPDKDGGWREAFDRSEIAVMRADGTEFRVLPLSEGLKMNPVMCHDDRHIAYWRATQRRPGSKSFAEKFDVWEVDLQTGEDKPFAGEWKFFQGGQIQYLKKDEQIVFGTDIPTSGNVPGLTEENAMGWRSAYAYKHRHSFMHILGGGTEELPGPLNTGVSSARAPSLDADQNLYFIGDKPTASFFRMSKDGGLTQWEYPWGSMGQELDVAALPDGSGIVFIFYYRNEDSSRKGIALFNVQQETWVQINISDFEKGTPIEIKAATISNH